MNILDDQINDAGNNGMSDENRANLPPCILLVDDDLELTDAYSHILTYAGYEVHVADDGEAGWKELESSQANGQGYDLLITDNNMPKLTGVGLVRRLRAAHMNLPVIMVTGDSSVNTDSLHLSAILSKPFNGDQLIRTVESVLSLLPAAAFFKHQRRSANK